MELVQNQESKVCAVADDAAIDLILPRHEELKHHEVGEKNVRGVIRDPSPLVPTFLPSVAGERDPLVSRRLVDELAELLHLGVGERVHGVDNDGTRAPSSIRSSQF